MAGFACQKRRLRNSVVGYPVSSVAPLVTNICCSLAAYCAKLSSWKASWRAGSEGEGADIWHRCVVVERGGVGGGRMFAARQKFRNDPLDSPIQKRIGIPSRSFELALFWHANYTNNVAPRLSIINSYQIFATNSMRMEGTK